MAYRRKEESTEKAPKFNKQLFLKALGIFRYLSNYKGWFAIGFTLLVLGSLLFMIFPVASGEFLNIASGHSRYGITLQQLGIGLLILLVIQSFISYFRVVVFTYISEKVMGDIRMDVYSKLITLPIPFFEKTRVGELSSRLSSDVTQMQDTITFTGAEFFRQFIVLLASIAYLIIMMPGLSLLMLGIFPVIVVFALVFGKYIRRFSKQRQDELAQSQVIIDETFQSIHSVKAFHNEHYEVNRYQNSIQTLIKTSLRFGKAKGLYIAFIIAIMFGAIFFVLWQGAIQVQNGKMQVGDLVTFMVVTAVIGGSIGGLGDLYTQLMKTMGASERILEILNEKEEIHLETSTPFQRIHGDIQFKNVQFSYPSRAEVQVLKGIHMHIPEGAQIALVGHSGAGKSTITALLLQFYKLDAGVITIGGTSIQDFDLGNYRKNIAVVPQEVILFGGTILENIRYGKPEASMDEIIEAARKSYCLEFIEQFPEGFQTIVGERGIKLSGGQKQRIAIARAILRDPAILILDEATSSLDAESERIVQKALAVLMHGRTSIVIAHRLSTIKNSSAIYVLDAGQIVEQGTHEELSRKEQGIYAALSKIQFQEEQPVTQF